jgi:CTP synthase
MKKISYLWIIFYEREDIEEKKPQVSCLMKVIVVVGGVISGVGKGIATASICKILQEYGYSVTAVKIDPYINYDAGTLRPTEHGEVWVTDDGGEIDQDLGNYERFLGFELSRKNNITTGQVYKELIDRERRGEFLGQTVEVIPHVPNEIKRRIKEAGKGFDFVVVEVGGTVGDYQNMPYLFATKNLEIEFGRENVIHILVSYMPVPNNIGEMKTKPTQQAIKMLNETGIFPDFVLCRSTKPLDDVRKKKLEQNANMDADSVISAPDVTCVYSVPLNLERDNLGMKILKRMNTEPRKYPEWGKWREFVEKVENPKRKIKIAMVGKYVDIGNFTLADSYISINESLKHAGASAGVGVDIEWVDSKQFEHGNTEVLDNYAGIIIPGGFGSSGVEGKIAAIKYARENNIPFLGLCYGLQLAVIEYSRNVCGMHGAHTTEVDPNTGYPVIDVIPDQRALLEKKQYGASMRLGAYAASLKEGTKTLELYRRFNRVETDKEKIEKIMQKGETFRIGISEDKNLVLERHRHRYEVNPRFVEKIEKAGLVFSGQHIRTDGTRLMEFGELPHHPFFIGTQAHPEFKSNPENPAPLFVGFVEACIARK